MHYLGIDLGGTNIAVGIVDENMKIIARATSKTQVDSPEQVADAFEAQMNGKTIKSLICFNPDAK